MKKKKGLFFINILVCLLLVLTGCKIESASNTDVPGTTGQDYNKLFELRLYSDKQTYKTNEKIQIWATLKYTGSGEQIKIWHADPYISFTISDGKDFNTGGFFLTILTSTVLEKDKLYRFDYVKSGGFTAEDPKADFWKKFYQEKDLFLPEGEYKVKVSGAFSLSQDDVNSKSNLYKELNIKVIK